MIEQLLRIEFWASAGSIGGFILTVWILVTVRQLRAAYLFKARVPELLERLQNHAGNLSRSLNDYSQFSDEAAVEIARLLATLKSLRSKLPRPAAATLRQLVLDIERHGLASSERGLRDIYLRIVTSIDEISDLMKDKEWIT